MAGQTPIPNKRFFVENAEAIVKELEKRHAAQPNEDHFDLVMDYCAELHRRAEEAELRAHRAEAALHKSATDHEDQALCSCSECVAERLMGLR